MHSNVDSGRPESKALILLRLLKWQSKKESIKQCWIGCWVCSVNKRFLDHTNSRNLPVGFLPYKSIAKSSIRRTERARERIPSLKSCVCAAREPTRQLRKWSLGRTLEAAAPEEESPFQKKCVEFPWRGASELARHSFTLLSLCEKNKNTHTESTSERRWRKK